MKIARLSPRTNTWNVMDIPVTHEQMDAWESGVLIQNAMPDLMPDEREFIMTGFTPADWAAMFGEE